MNIQIHDEEYKMDLNENLKTVSSHCVNKRCVKRQEFLMGKGFALCAI